MDLALAFRRLRTAPAFAAAAALTLALGVGANTLAFSAIRGLLVQPLPFPHGDELVWVQGSDHGPGSAGEIVGGDEAGALAARMTSAEGIAVIGSRTLIRPEGQRRSEWKGLWVTANLLRVLRVEPVLGRTFLESDMSSGAAPAAMIAFERWQRDFGGDPSLIGRVLPFADGKAVTVIGVLPAGLQFPFGRAPGAGSGTEFRVGTQDFWTLGQRRTDEYPGGMALARLRPGTVVSAAQAEIDAIVASMPAGGARPAGRSLRLVTFRDHALGVLRPALPLLEGFAAFVLLIACANLASLVLARAAKSRGEFAVRAALGAETRDVLRLLFAESFWICAGGAVAGIALAAAGRALLVAFAADQVALVRQIRIDPAVLAFTALLTVVVTVVFAILPMTVVRETPAAALLDRGSRGHTIGRRQSRTFRLLVITQVAVTLLLLNAAALVYRSLSRLMSVDTGYEARLVVAADVLLYEPPKEVVAYFRTLHERLRVLPGVEAVGLVSSTPLTGKWTFTERIGGRDVAGTFVAFDYFKAMGIPLLAGRDFTATEFLGGSGRVLIVNDVAARLFFPGEAAVGRHLVINDRPREIVGVVKGTRDVRLDTAAEPQFYQPTFTGGSQVIVRTANDSRAFVETLRRELSASDPRLIVKRVEPLETILDTSVFERRLATRLLTVFAGLALVLAVVGLYAVLSFTTEQRRRELGVRAALGARRTDLIRLVLGQGLGMTAAGVLAGLLASIAAAAWLQTLLFGIPARDPATAAIAVVVLTTTAAAACALPAWRAGSTSPAITLRGE